MDDHDKKKWTEQIWIARSGKSEAELALEPVDVVYHWITQETSRGLSAPARLLVEYSGIATSLGQNRVGWIMG